jgi:hypothetical protein
VVDANGIVQAAVFCRDDLQKWSFGHKGQDSEIRPPVSLKTRQKSCTSKGARRAALMKRRRSAALRYFRLPVEP